jgi:hypothetical protein
VCFWTIPISMNIAKTIYVLSTIMGFQSRILEQSGIVQPHDTMHCPAKVLVSCTIISTSSWVKKILKKSPPSVALFASFWNPPLPRNRSLHPVYVVMSSHVNVAAVGTP